jgi:hypothetical protein
MSIGSNFGGGLLPTPLPYDPSNGGQNATNFAPGGYYNRTGSLGAIPGMSAPPPSTGGSIGSVPGTMPGPGVGSSFGSLPGPVQPVNPWGSSGPSLPPWYTGGGGGMKPPMNFGSPQPVNPWGSGGPPLPPGVGGGGGNKPPMNFSGAFGNMGGNQSPQLVTLARNLLRTLNSPLTTTGRAGNGFRATRNPWQG